MTFSHSLTLLVLEAHFTLSRLPAFLFCQHCAVITVMMVNLFARGFTNWCSRSIVSVVFCAVVAAQGVALL